jgi:hypothetical protein
MIALYVSETLWFPTVFLCIAFWRCPKITLSSQREATSSLCEPNYTQLTEGSNGVKMGVKVGETLVANNRPVVKRPVY